MILAILQARLGSTRLPGKVLLPILEQPMLALQLERVRRAQAIDTLVVATSSGADDEPVALLCEKLEVPCFRGNLTDVLDRYYKAAQGWNAEHIVRLTGDCPLADPEIIDRIIDTHLQANNAYTSNTIKPTYPDGLDVEVFTIDALNQAWSESRSTHDREHVTPFIHQKPERFQLGNVESPTDYSHLRWTVDEMEDFELVKRIYEHLYPQKNDFQTNDVLELIARHPELGSLNLMHKRNEGFLKSMHHEQQQSE